MIPITHLGACAASAHKEIAAVLKRHGLQAVVVFFDEAGGRHSSPSVMTVSGGLEPELVLLAGELLVGMALPLYQRAVTLKAVT